MIQAIFFDFNGVIIDDEPLQMAAYKEVLHEQGIELTESDYYSALGMDDKTFVRANPDVALGMLGALSDRLRRTDELLRSRVSRNANEEERKRATMAGNPLCVRAVAVAQFVFGVGQR